MIVLAHQSAPLRLRRLALVAIKRAINGIMSISGKQDQDGQNETAAEAPQFLAAEPAEVAIPDAPIHACSNCGSELIGHFCAICGQPNKESRRPLYSLLAELLHVLLDLDGRAYRTLFFLFTRPAYLTRAYIDGQRANYTAPLRLFLAISIVFFIFVSLQNAYESLRESIDEIQTQQSGTTLETEQPSDVQSEESVDALTGNDIAEEFDGEDIDWLLPLIDRINIPFLSGQTNENLHAVMRQQAAENYAALLDDPGEALRDLLEYITVFILFMIPILATMQFLVFFLAKRYYIEHLILTLHNHAFVILAFMIISLVGIIEDAEISILSPVASVVSTLTLIWMPVYLLLSLKFYFGWGWLATIPIFIVTSITYAATMGVGIAAFALLLFLMP